MSYAQTLEQDIALLYAACERSYTYHQASAEKHERKSKRTTRWLQAIAGLASVVGESAMEHEPYPEEGAPYSGVRSRWRPAREDSRPAYSFEEKAAAEAAEARAEAASLNASIMALHDFIEDWGDPDEWDSASRAEYRVLFEDAEQKCLRR